MFNTKHERVGLDWLNMSIVVSAGYIKNNYPQAFAESPADYYKRVSDSLKWDFLGPTIARFLAFRLGYGGTIAEPGGGAFGYTWKMELEKGFSIMYGDSYHNGINIQISGSALASLRAKGFDEAEFVADVDEFADSFCTSDFPVGVLVSRVTRADISLDFINYGFSVHEIYKRYIENESYKLLTEIKEFDETRVQSKVDGIINDSFVNTIYVGSKKSGKTFVRVYNKRAEQEKKLEEWQKFFGVSSIDDWVRAEVQLMKEDAVAFMNAFVTGKGLEKEGSDLGLVKLSDFDRDQLLLREVKNRVRIWDTSECEFVKNGEATAWEYVQKFKRRKWRENLTYDKALELTGCKLSTFSKVIEDLAKLGGVAPLAKDEENLLSSKAEHFISNTGVGRLLYEISKTYEYDDDRLAEFVRSDFADAVLDAVRGYGRKKAAKSSGYIERNKERNQEAGLPLFGIAPSKARSSHSDDRGE